MTINESPAPLWAQYGEDIAQQLFVLGFVCSKLKDLPLGNWALFFLGGCLTSFCLAYTIQIATSTEYKQVESDTFWNYSFLYGLTATIGAALCVTVLMNPSLSLIGLWLFSFNHLLWYAAESNRRTYPTFFPKQPRDIEAHLDYVKWISIAFISTTVSSTLAVLFPNFSSGIVLSGLVLNYISTSIAFISPKFSVTDFWMIATNHPVGLGKNA
jgi:hypothetical protein